jgi:TonB family protein
MSPSISLIIAAALFVTLGPIVLAQSPVVSLRLKPDQIGLVKTAQGISTRVAFREVVSEVICGDLYDPVRGTGSFVVQKLGNDVFIKPVTSKSFSNMFVRTGENGEFIYSFDLVIVPVDQAYRIVNTVNLVDSIVAASSKPQQPRRSISIPPVITSITALEAESERMKSGIADNLFIIAQGSAEPAPPPAPAAIREKPVNGSTGGDANRIALRGEPKKRVPAIYPDYAKQLGIGGLVVVEVTVDEKGKVLAARAISGHAILGHAAVSAAREWRFEPTIIDGMAVKAVGQIIFNFERPADRRGRNLGSITEPINPQWGDRRKPPR